MSRPYDERVYDWADAIALVMERDPERTWTPSGIARKAHLETWQAADALRWMKQERFIYGDGRGAWEHYRPRRAGEYLEPVR